jgi:tRNA(fMet)-specific endonuclease VapC
MSQSAVLVDTDVISFLATGHPIGNLYRDALTNRHALVSVVSLGEIEYGMEWREWGAARRQNMRKFLARFAPLTIEIATSTSWSQLRAECRRKGRPISNSDAWIAATALTLGVPLITHNASDYQAIESLAVITAAV